MSVSISSYRFAPLLAACAIGLGGVAMAQTPSGATGGMSASAGTAGAKSKADGKFVEKAAISGQAEIMMGQMAQKKASHADVKQFADRMVQDHRKASEELTQIASSKGMAPPPMTDKAHQKDADKLDKLSGDAFDREYMKHMVAGHKSTVAEFEKEAKSGKDAELKAFASRTLPTLKEHLKQAQTTEAALRKAKSS